MGKGSRARPFEVPQEQFSSNWDKIFGKKDVKEESKDKPAKTDESKKDK